MKAFFMQLVFSLGVLVAVKQSTKGKNQKATSFRVGILVHLSSKESRLDDVITIHINSSVERGDVVESRERS